MALTLNSLPFGRITGLLPDVWLCVGAGYSREELKSIMLQKGLPFIKDAIMTLEELCLKVAGVRSEQVLSPTTRQEALRALLSRSEILGRVPELNRLRRQKSCFKSLDQTLQTARMCFAHAQEEEVYEARLNRESPLRREMKILAQAFETWMSVSGYYDLPMLIQRAVDVLKEGRFHCEHLPQQIIYLSHQTLESKEREFWDYLRHCVPVSFGVPSEKPQTENPQEEISRNFETEYSAAWIRYHTLDDASEALLEEILKQVKCPSDWDEHIVLIPDDPGLRRSLNRVASRHRIPLADPRDPTRLRWDESVKWALLPLQVVAGQFERKKVISWLRNYQNQQEFPEWVKEINSRGIRYGLPSYFGGVLTGVHSRLKELNQDLGSRKTVREVADAHLKILRSNVLHTSAWAEDPKGAWLLQLFERLWRDLESDLQSIESADRRAPLFYWLERLQNRIWEASPPVDPVKPKQGLQIYRLQQAPLKTGAFLWILGLPPHWLKGEGTGSEWFSERDREVLSVEFAVRSWIQVRQERIQNLSSWIQGASQVRFFDANYEYDGQERESISTVLQELAHHGLGKFPSRPKDCGAHPRSIPSYRAPQLVQPQSIRLPSLRNPFQVPQLTASLLERYSRCPVQALALHRWKLNDIREPEFELWPDEKGKVLHEAVRILMESLHPFDLFFQKTPEEALTESWEKISPRGLIQTERIQSYVRSRLLKVLIRFCEMEQEYLRKSGALPAQLDGTSVKIEYPDFVVKGVPDRIDQHPDGLFVMDYKTSGQSPHGTEMLENAYRLQLPFYALAVQKTSKREVLGVQFVELSRKGSRRSGIFFRPYNGKEAGKLTSVRSNSKSLVDLSPQQAWKIFEEYMVQDARNYIEGIFEATPRTTLRERECQTCRIGDLCGSRRTVFA